MIKNNIRKYCKDNIGSKGEKFFNRFALKLNERVYEYRTAKRVSTGEATPEDSEHNPEVIENLIKTWFGYEKFE